MHDLRVWQQVADMLSGRKRWDTPGDLAREITPGTRQTPALDLIDAELVRLADTPDGRLIISLPPQEGKALALDTPIPTPDGWRMMGDLQPGDRVFGGDGQACTVTWVSPVWEDRPCYKVTTGDGDTIIADAAHEWVARLDRRCKPRTVETSLLAKARSKNAQIEAHGIITDVAELPLDPYVLGVWLGDSNSSGPIITMHADDVAIRDRFAAAGWPLKYLGGMRWSMIPAGWVNGGGYRPSPAKAALKVLGVLGNKHVPVEYLRASREQRLALLQGLVDSDGHVLTKGQVEFCSTNLALAEGVRELVYSLGAKATLHESRATLYGKDCGAKYRVRFYLADAAHLPRKRERCKDSSVASVRYVTATPCESVPTVCIEVDSPDHLFLAGRSMLPTHNSTRVMDFVVWLLAHRPETRVATASYAQGLANRNGRRLRNTIQANPWIGLSIAPDNGAVSEWTLAGHEGGVLSVGRGAGITGRPVDCVAGDTLIECEYGTLTAADAYTLGIKWIRAYDHDAGIAGWHRVEASRRIERRPVVEVVTESGRVLTCTSDHRVHTGRGYVPAGALLPGDQITNLMGGIGIPQVSTDAVQVVRAVRGEGVPVYDFQVEGAHNFFANGLLVHNCLIIDDPLKDRAEADSQVVRDNCWDWWTDSLSTRLAPGAPVILILTRWHNDDLAGRLLDAPDGHLWRVVNIPAQAETASDPLGRQPGEFLDSARNRTVEQWEAIKVRAGSRTWASLYQGRPSPAEGGLVKRDWWQTYHDPLWSDAPDGTRWATDMDQVLISADLTFKGGDKSDRVAIGVWGRKGAHAYLLDLVCDRMDFTDSVHAFVRLAERWPQANLKLVEDAANGPALMSMLSGRISGIVPVKPTAGKVPRLNAVAPFIEAGNVHIPSQQLASWVGDYVEEHAAFPNGAHDDQVDMTSQALDRLLVRPLHQAGQTFDLVDDILGNDFHIINY